MSIVMNTSFGVAGSTTTTTVASPTSTTTGGGEGNGNGGGGKIKLSAVHAAAKLFKDPQHANAKTPISLLQEICTKSLLAPPIYELVAAEGQTHAPTFAYRCHLTNEWVAVGRGTSKKRAKHAAALAVLNLVRERYVGVNDMLVDALTNLM